MLCILELDLCEWEWGGGVMLGFINVFLKGEGGIAKSLDPEF
jgi:hypothetical protein